MLIICFSDYWHKKEYLRLDKSESAENSLERQHQTRRTLKCVIDAITYFYWHRELTQFQEFRSILLEHPALRNTDVLILQIVPPHDLGFDWLW